MGKMKYMEQSRIYSVSTAKNRCRGYQVSIAGTFIRALTVLRADRACLIDAHAENGRVRIVVRGGRLRINFLRIWE